MMRFCDRVLAIQFEIGSLLSCLLRMETTLTTPLS